VIRAWLAIGFALGASLAQAAPMMLDGELFARRSSAILPPAIDDLWQLNITQLAPDGKAVKQGDVVVTFDGGEVQKNLLAKQSTLKEKQAEFEKLTLDLDERERNERLATQEQRARLEKAQRKATQPVELLRRVDYQKLVIEREQAEAQMRLTAQREVLAAEQRRQERRLLQSEIDLLQADVALLTASLAALRVSAPRDGVMLHKSNFQGEKFDVGSQIWRGQAVAEIPDPGTLAVRAVLPERDLTRLQPGARARVSIEGGAGRALSARVEDIGRVVRSKSRVQPVPILDVTLTLEGDLDGLKPGQPVRVEILDPGKAPGLTGEASR
jgi:multidrug resistance efflux pump